MSAPSIPAPDDQDKPFFILDDNLWRGWFRLAIVAPSRRRPPRKSGLYAMLHAAQQHGFTPPNAGFWVMLPKEFDAILALEPKAVAQVVLEILRQTIGTVVYGQDGRPRLSDSNGENMAHVRMPLS